jgi:hypothetical protein
LNARGVFLLLAFETPLLPQLRGRFKASLDTLRQCLKQLFAARAVDALVLMTFDGHEIASATLAGMVAKCADVHKSLLLVLVGGKYRSALLSTHQNGKWGYFMK